MDDRMKLLRDRLNDTLIGCDAPPPDYRGKVRDVYVHDDEMWIVTTDRVSAFDVVLGTIPLKGALLTAQATFWLEKASAVVETHLKERVDAQVMRCRRATALPIELVVRGYLAGSLLREPAETRGQAYGLTLDPSLTPYQAFANPIVTPTTKAPSGQHDEAISLDGLVARGLVSRARLDEAVEAARALFDLGARFARDQGLLLVDTKYEFGVIDDRLVLIDEIHTADSSRYWRADTYAARVAAGETPDMLDKERLRRWLLAQGFDGHGAPPALSDEIRLDLASHYWALTEQVTGAPFVPPALRAKARIEALLAQRLGRA